MNARLDQLVKGILDQSRRVEPAVHVGPAELAVALPEQRNRILEDPDAAKRQLKLLWVACGNKDGLIRISQGVHAYLKEKGVPHVWHVDGNAHDPTEWRNNLYLFVQRIFR